MNNTDKQYFNLVRDILANGIEKIDRTGIGTISVFARQLRFKLSEGFPILTTKKLHWKSIVGELLWFLSGSTSAKKLRDSYEVTIWDEWADENGELGPIYGKQWVSWQAVNNESGTPYFYAINQIQKAIDLLRTDPDSRRMIVSAWNVSELKDMALQPCHVMFQLYTHNMSLEERCYEYSKAIGKSEYYTKKLTTDRLDKFNFPNRRIDLHMYQRSADLGLGVPFNISSYALLLSLIADQVNMIPSELIISYGDVHIYRNHISKLKDQLKRDPKKLPTLELEKKKSIFDCNPEDINLKEYIFHPPIKMKVAV